MDTVFQSVAERRRLERLAGALSTGWIVAPADDSGEVAAAAASASRVPVLCVVSGRPLPAMARLAAAGLRARVHLCAGGAAMGAVGWSLPVGLLCLPSGDPEARALFGAWGRHVTVGGHVLFYGGLGPPADALRFSPDFWLTHAREGRLFLLTRRPHG